MLPGYESQSTREQSLSRLLVGFVAALVTMPAPFSIDQLFHKARRQRDSFTIRKAESLPAAVSLPSGEVGCSTDLSAALTNRRTPPGVEVGESTGDTLPTSGGGVGGGDVANGSHLMGKCVGEWGSFRRTSRRLQVSSAPVHLHPPLTLPLATLETTRHVPLLLAPIESALEGSAAELTIPARHGMGQQQAWIEDELFSGLNFRMYPSHTTGICNVGI
ncbi:MAG: hypothetical protein SGPRY_013211 [Prymnesium sp.]